MKRILTTLFFIALSGSLIAQNIEVTFQANSGLFRYGGSQAEASSLLIGTTNGQAYTNNPYGNKNGISYGGTLQAQVVSKQGFIVGLGAGYDVLRSKIIIAYYYPNNSPNANSVSFVADGRTFLQSNFINLNPYFGYRLNSGKVKLDITPGLDIAFKTNAREHGKATYQNGTIIAERDRTDIKHDTRIRIGVTAIYGRFGVSANYAHGLVNQIGPLYADPAAQYSSVSRDFNYTANDRIAKSELIRFGISYRLL